MRVLLFRHGEKQDISSPDPELSPRGVRQAENLAIEVPRHFKKNEPWRLLSSPRRRTEATMSPLSQTLKKPFVLDARLLEMQPHEDRSSFFARLRDLQQEIESTPEPAAYALSTHIDVAFSLLNLFHLSHLPPNFEPWLSAQWVLIERPLETSPWRINQWGRSEVP